MSKLPNAPLVEVIYEIHWPSGNSDDLQRFEMILGAIFLELKDDFPEIIQLRPDPQIPLNLFLDKPTHRFQKEKDIIYPLYQLGPGILSINTIDKYYDWNDFSKLILKINTILNKTYKFDTKKELTVGLKYIDFYKLDYSKEIRNLYRELFNFDVNVSTAMLKETSQILLNIESAYKTSCGIMSFSLKRANMTLDNNEGIIFESGIQKKILADEYISTLTNWLKESHESLSTFFKEITKGSTYESFK